MAFIVSEGSLQSVSRPASRPRYSVRLADGMQEDYSAIWRAQPAVRTCVTFLARNIGQLGLHAFERLSDTERKRLTEHPIARLIAKPNPHTTRYRLFNDLVHDLGIFDAGYWLKAGTPSEPRVLRLPPTMTKPAGDSWLMPDKFVVKGTKGEVEYAADRVVYFRGYNPDDPREGTPPIEGIRRILAEEYAAGRMREQVLRNGARMAGYLTRPAQPRGRDGAGSKSWTPEARDRFKADWQAQYTGEGPQAGGTPILEDGMTFVPASQTSEQLEYVAARKLTREEVAAIYFIPPPMVGILDHATFGNITEQHKMLYQDTLGPWLTMLQDEIGLQLVSELPASEQVYVEFNLEEKLRGSFEEQAAQLQTSVGAPWLTRNEARARRNLAPVEGGDVLIVPLNVLEGGLASPRDTAPDPADAGKAAAPRTKSGTARGYKARASQAHVTKAEQVLRAFFKRQRESVLGRLGSKAGEDVWDDERWDRELSDDLYALSATVTAAVAAKALAALGYDESDYDQGRTLKFLRTVADRIATSTNAATKASVLAAVAAAGEGDSPVEDVKHVFDVAEQARAPQSALTTITTLSGFATVEAGKQVGGDAVTKTWVTTSSNPRASHAAMDGETVGIGEKFSNGAMWPADQYLDVDDRAGCECDVIISIP